MAEPSFERRDALKVEKIVLSVGLGSFLHGDSLAQQSGKAVLNGYTWIGEPMLPGFTKIQEKAQIVSLMLIMEDGTIAHGDCVDVAAAGFSGRDRVFLPHEHMDDIRKHVAEPLVGVDITDFRALAEQFDRPQANGRRLHTAVRYGVTQAILHAAALSRREQMVEVIARDYKAEGAEIETVMPRILASCMRDNHNLHERMIVKRADLLPHANFGLVDKHVGRDGQLFIDWISKFAARIKELGDADYMPTLHFDVYGAFAKIFDYDLEKVADYLGRCKEAVSPYALMIESPIVAEQSREQQIDLYKQLHRGRVVQHGRGRDRVRRGRRGGLLPDQDPGPGGHQQHHRGRALLQARRHGVLSRRLEQRDRPVLAHHHPYRAGVPAGLPAFQAGHGRRRGGGADDQRDEPHPGAARRQARRLTGTPPAAPTAPSRDAAGRGFCLCYRVGRGARVASIRAERAE
jgi:methylaspartate ammonia-lyase